MAFQLWRGRSPCVASAHLLAAQPAPFANCLGESFPRAFTPTDGLTILASGTLHLVSIPLQQGQPVTNLAFAADTPGMVGPLNWWFALYTQTLVFCRATADQTTTAWAAFTVKQLALTATYTPTYTGIHYAGIMCKATTNPPTLAGMSQASYLTGIPPTRFGTSTAGLTTTAPSPAGGLTAAANPPYVYAT